MFTYAFKYFSAKLGIRFLQGCTNCGSLTARKWRENEKMKRKWRENEELKRKWREWIFLFFPPSLSISHIKNCIILLQNVKYVNFFANVTKNLTLKYAPWENSLGSNSLRESSASCEGLVVACLYLDSVDSLSRALNPWSRCAFGIILIVHLLSNLQEVLLWWWWWWPMEGLHFLKTKF